MQRKNLPKVCGTVMRYFNQTIAQLDSIVHFVKRKSKLNAQLFAHSLILGCLSDPAISLERMCKLLKHRGIKITKQGLHQRFNSNAVKLMQHLFLECLQQFKTEKCNLIDLLKPFSSVKFIDSSGISLPEELKNTFRGTGGKASEAGLKIQVYFDYLQGQINQLTITEGCQNDQGFSDHLSRIEKNSLHLQDLGYFKLKSFEEIHAKGAYFISRYPSKTLIFDKENKPINLLKELRKSREFYAKEISINVKERFPMRLIAFRLSDEDAKKRIRRIKRKAQNKGRTLSKEYLEFCHWSVFITNIQEEIMNNKQIHLVYSLRWQIELIFKLCKSEAGIDKVNGKKYTRILCEIYAKLICIVILLYLCFPLRWQENCEISFRKAYKQMKLLGLDFFKALRSRYRLRQFMTEFFADMMDFAFKDKHRKERRLTYQKLMDSTGQEVLA